MLNSTDIAPVIFQEGFGKINIAEKRERAKMNSNSHKHWKITGLQ